MKPNIHILGIQGSGKGTQSSLLVERFGLTYVSSGNLFRERASENDAFGKNIATQLSVGTLLPNQLLFETIDQFLSTHPVNSGFLGDGVIRSIEQYNGLLPIWEKHQLGRPFLLYLELTEDIALERIEKRQQDLINQQRLEHHRVYSGKLMHRTDDNPLAIEKRFTIFRTITKPIIAEFASANAIAHIPADQTVEEIHEQLALVLLERYPEFTHVTH